MAAATATADGLRAPELLAALRATATVLADHAAALDRLDASVSWDEVAGTTEVGTAPSGPDGPGTDLAAALAGACEAGEGTSDLTSLGAALAEGARGAARAVSGRRLARFLAGAADALRNADRLDGTRMALALEAGAERLALADDGAHPGGMPAVVAAAADAALAASDDGAGLGDVLVSAADAGLAELEQGPLVDPHLAERGTVDAAAAGFLLVLDSLASVVTGEPLPEPPRDEPEPTAAAVGTQRYRIRCVVTPPDGPDPEASADLEVLLHELSDIVSFAGSGETWAVDVRTGLPGAVVEALVGFGRPSELHIGLDAPSD